MSETGERLAAGFGWWLQKEAELARQPDNRNKIHDDFKLLRDGHLLPYGDPNNRSLAKSAGHETRYLAFIHGLLDQDLDMRDPRVSARLAHHALMFAAGGARMSAALRAGDQYQYDLKRAKPYDIALLPVVETTVNEIKPDDYHSEGIVYAQALITLARIRNGHQGAIDWFTTYPSRAYDQHYPIAPPVERMQGIQREGVRLAAVVVIVAAHEQGIGIEDVAVLEPKSITDVGPPIYPFRDQFKYQGDILELHGRAAIPNRH